MAPARLVSAFAAAPTPFSPPLGILILLVWFDPRKPRSLCCPVRLVLDVATSPGRLFFLSHGSLDPWFPFNSCQEYYISNAERMKGTESGRRTPGDNFGFEGGKTPVWLRDVQSGH